MPENGLGLAVFRLGLAVAAVAAGFAAGWLVIGVLGAILPPFGPQDDDTLRDRVPVVLAYLAWGVTSLAVFVLGWRGSGRRRPSAGALDSPMRSDERRQEPPRLDGKKERESRSSFARLALVTVAVVALGTGGVTIIAPDQQLPPPSEAQARAALHAAVAHARAGDFAGLCDLSDGNCAFILGQAGRDAVPADPPTVFGMRVIEPTTLANRAWQGGGRVLQVCGIDGRGQPYRSEVLAFRDGQTVRLINAVYWSRVSISAIARTQTGPSVAVASGVPQAADGCPASRDGSRPPWENRGAIASSSESVLRDRIPLTVLAPAR